MCFFTIPDAPLAYLLNIVRYMFNGMKHKTCKQQKATRHCLVSYFVGFENFSTQSIFFYRYLTICSYLFFIFSSIGERTVVL